MDTFLHERGILGLRGRIWLSVWQEIVNELRSTRTYEFVKGVTELMNEVLRLLDGC